jgi:hypothetical protein
VTERVIQLCLAVSILAVLIAYGWGIDAASMIVGGGLIGLVCMEVELRLEKVL